MLCLHHGTDQAPEHARVSNAAVDAWMHAVLAGSFMGEAFKHRFLTFLFNFAGLSFHGPVRSFHLHVGCL